MSKREPIDPTKLRVGDMVEWVDRDNVWDVQVLELKPNAITVDYGWKTALFTPSSEDPSRYVLAEGGNQMEDEYLRHSTKNKKEQE